ncbi:hypothetical protein [Paenibacillus abyssi]|uniref:Uncharacterized protein n=1 Tax=Paenibacillus abyssi TaxID=1340531 RepID=A0A917LE95_9BACL|nr:hypothetical protein [Paenibacillus abyssi]GGG15148.1 hypothetical protein GCM10010916_35060 [Paenibacillus abyssi]
MGKIVSFTLELARILVLLVIMTTILSWAEKSFYPHVITWKEHYNWYLAAGNFIVFLILYRNYFQFKGWYKSAKKRKLSKPMTLILTGLFVVCLLLPILPGT